MRFHVGTTIYRGGISDDISDDGQPRHVAVIEHSHEIILSAAAPIAKRLALLGYALMEAWCLETGTPDSRQGWCDLAGTMVKGLIRDLSLYGGAAALERLRPGESPEPLAMRVTCSTARTCAQCAGSVASGSVVCLPSNVSGFAELAIYCDFCSHVQRWRELATATGLPTGQMLGEPRFERGEAAGVFLAKWPEAAGVGVI